MLFVTFYNQALPPPVFLSAPVLPQPLHKSPIFQAHNQSMRSTNEHTSAINAVISTLNTKTLALKNPFTRSEYRYYSHKDRIVQLSSTMRSHPYPSNTSYPFLELSLDTDARSNDMPQSYQA